MEEDPNLKRLREEARRRLDKEEREPPRTVYGGPPPPQPVYGGPPVPLPGRRWTLKGIVILAAAIIAAVAAWIFAGKTIAPAAVYGGPPPRPGPPPER